MGLSRTLCLPSTLYGTGVILGAGIYFLFKYFTVQEYFLRGEFMYFLIGLFILTTLILGINFCFLLVGGTPFDKGEESAPVMIGHRKYSVGRFAVGVSTSVFGASWLVAWSYFLLTGWDSFVAQFADLITHVVLQFLSSLGLLVAGIGIFKQWKRSKGIFLISMATMMASIGVSIVVYGPRGHGDPIFMYLLGAWTVVVGGFFTVIVYFIDRLKNEFDDTLCKTKTDKVLNA